MKTLTIKCIKPTLSKFTVWKNDLGEVRNLYFQVEYNKPESITCNGKKKYFGPINEMYEVEIRKCGQEFLYLDREVGIARYFRSLDALCWEYEYSDYLETIKMYLE